MSGGSQKRPWSAADYPYKVDYNDHFETPLIAYQDIAPLLDFWLAHSKTTKTKQDLVIYDPYYCHGQTQKHFRELGFEGIINLKRDFYHDLQHHQIPEFDVLVTNPPYSDQHKQKCLDFALQQLRTTGKPFFLLMPNYVASRDYYRTREQGDVMYLIPSIPYEYTHPEGTGKDLPPFVSLWYCGIPDTIRQPMIQYWNNLAWNHHHEANGRSKPSLVMNWDQLKETGSIPIQKRPNPRQRKKKKRRQHVLPSAEPLVLEPCHDKIVDSQQVTTSQKPAASHTQLPQPNRNNNKIHKKSKHRDGTGQRKRRRF